MPARVRPDNERIRQLLAQGVQQRVIAKRFGVSERAVHRVAKGGQR